MSYGGGDLDNLKGIQGSTDGTAIGNTGDRLKVDASFSSTPTVSEAEIPTFVSYASAVALANNKSLFSIVNTGSSFLVRIREIRIINTQTSAVTGVIADFRMFRITGHSSGTLLVGLTSDTNDTLDSSVTARTGSTVAGEASDFLRRWLVSTDEWGVGSSDVESMQHIMQTYSNPAYYPTPKTKPITLRQNQGITIKNVTNTTVGTFDIAVIYTQEGV
jgi:hypothetical protein